MLLIYEIQIDIKVLFWLYLWTDMKYNFIIKTFIIV